MFECCIVAVIFTNLQIYTVLQSVLTDTVLVITKLDLSYTEFFRRVQVLLLFYYTT